MTSVDGILSHVLGARYCGASFVPRISERICCSDESPLAIKRIGLRITPDGIENIAYDPFGDKGKGPLWVAYHRQNGNKYRFGPTIGALGGT